MSSSAAATFAGLPELLLCLVGQIQSSKHLATLRLVSKHFHNAVTPALFSAVAPISAATFTAGRVEELAELAERNLVGYVRRLTFEAVDRDGAPAANIAIQGLLANMPFLESFNCSCPMLPETIEILHRSCPRLKSLLLDFKEMEYLVLELHHDRPGDEVLRARQQFRMPDLTVFANLEMVNLLNLYGDTPQWQGQVAQVLKNSPGLRSFGLSLSLDALERRYSHDPDQYWLWFIGLCESYIELGGLPLPLRSLFCGTGIFPRNGAHLQQLVNLSYLEEVFIKNEDVWGQDQMMILYDDGDDSEIVFDTFVDAPNLRRLVFATYGGDVHRAITSMRSPAKASRMAIFAQQGLCYEPTDLLRPDSKYPALPLHPRMLEMELDRAKRHSTLRDEDWHPRTDLPPANELLDSLVNGDDGALEGQVLYLPGAKLADPRPGDDDEQRIWDDPRTWDEQYGLLERTLPKLTNLSQLCIHVRGHDIDAYGDVAPKLALAIPSLRNISVVIDHRFGLVDTNYRRIVRDDERGVTLVELEGRTENEKVELYRLSQYKWYEDHHS